MKNNLFEIDTPNGKDLYLKVQMKFEDTIDNRNKLHEFQDKLEEIKEKKKNE